MKLNKIDKSESIKLLNLFVLIICSIVGVGFISGAEIYQFYVRFGKYFYIGIFAFFILVFLLTRKIILNFYYNKNKYKMLKNNNNCVKNTFLVKNNIKSFLIFFDVLMIASAMISGLNNMTKQLFKNNYFIIMIACIIIVFFILCIGINGLSKVDYVLMLFIIFIGVIFILNLCDFISFDLQSSTNKKYINDDVSWGSFIFPIIFASLYVFMNIIQLEPILKEYKVTFTKKSINIFSLVLSGFLSIVLLLFSIFLNNNIKLTDFSMPFLTFFENISPTLKFIYIIGLFLALISSLLSCLIGVKRGILKFSKNNIVASGFSVILVLLLGMISFSTYVSVIYPIIGAINFVIFIFL